MAESELVPHMDVREDFEKLEQTAENMVWYIERVAFEFLVILKSALWVSM